MDIRDIYAVAGKWYKEFDERHMVLTVELWDDNGDECNAFEIPAKFSVCGVCNGKGTMVDPNIDRNGITGEEFERDPQFFKEYRSGFYDTPCSCCHGKRVVPDADWPRLTPPLQKMLRAHIDEHFADAREQLNDAARGY